MERRIKLEEFGNRSEVCASMILANRVTHVVIVECEVNGSIVVAA
jgi:hypothetical protein